METAEKMEKIRQINPSYFDFLVVWQGIVPYLIFASIGVGIIIWVLHKIRVSSLKTPKEKYEYISKSEVQRFFIMHIAFAVAILFFVNYLEWETVAKDIFWFPIRAFIGIAAAILHGYVARLLLNYFWPSVMKKKLRKLRYTPRINPANGNKMKLLSESEEDVYLDEGMQAEENIFSVDYDVWVDEETGDTKIEKYDGRLVAEECDRCGFQTLKLQREEIIRSTIDDENRELEKQFKCGYCGRIKRRTVKISTTMDKDISSGRLITNPLVEEDRVVSVKVDIKSEAYNLLSYEFQTLREVLKHPDFQDEGYGIEQVKVEIFTKKDRHLKYQFQNLEEAKKFMDEFDIHNVIPSS